MSALIALNKNSDSSVNIEYDLVRHDPHSHSQAVFLLFSSGFILLMVMVFFSPAENNGSDLLHQDSARLLVGVPSCTPVINNRRQSNHLTAPHKIHTPLHSQAGTSHEDQPHRRDKDRTAPPKLTRSAVLLFDNGKEE
jgi:hypothetical protein